jgi:hypothetical protein
MKMQSIVAIVCGFRMLYPQNGSFTTVAVLAVAALDGFYSVSQNWIKLVDFRRQFGL